MFKKIFFPFIWIARIIQNYFKTAIFFLLIYLFFFYSSTPLEKPNLYKIYLNTQIMEAQTFLQEIKEAKKEHIKGVLLLVDSPGGAVAPSVEMAMAIKELAMQKPVVAYAMGTMASGSYYASIWSDAIIANPGSAIGSIGVKFDGYNIEKLAQKVGIDFQSAQAGKYKNAGTFKREWSEAEKKEIERLVHSIYSMFVKDVATARGLDIEKSSQYAEGRIFSAKEAVEVGLVDSLGSFSSSVSLLQKKANVAQAIFNEPDEIDKMLEKLNEKGVEFLMHFSPKLMSIL